MLAYLDVVCTALGGGLYDRSGTVGVSIFGSTGMHMRFVPDAGQVQLNEDRSGYTMCFPVPGAVASMQSNMAATLNIDWLLDIARRGRRARRRRHQPRRRSWPACPTSVLAAEPGAALYHPYIFEAGERGPFLDPNARAQFVGLSTRTRFAGLMRAVYEGLAFAARDCYLATGSIPREVRLGGGAARSEAIRLILASALDAKVRTVGREETGAAGAVMMAAVNLGHLSRHGGLRRGMGDPFARRGDRRPTRASSRFTRGSSTSIAPCARPCPPPGPSSTHIRQERAS